MTTAYEIIADRDIKREDWLEMRRHGIGASDAAGVLGISPWTSPTSIYADKLGVLEPQAESEPMYWGKRLESIVIEEFAKETKRKVAHSGECYRNVERRWQLCTLDGVQAEPEDGRGPGVLETKCSGRAEWEDGVPPDVFAQVQHQMAVTGWSWASVAVLVRGSHFFWADVERDEKFIQALNEREEEFWQRVLEERPPPTDASEATKKALARLYPEDSGETVVLPPEFLEKDQELQLIKAELKQLGVQKDEIENAIKAEIGNATFGALSDGTLYSFKKQEKKAYTVDATSFRALRRKGA